MLPAMKSRAARIALLTALCCAFTAAARQVESCEDHCHDKTRNCLAVCTKKGGARAAGQCKLGCGDFTRMCIKGCAKPKGKK